MILGKLQLIGIGVAFAAVIGASVWIYFQGKQEAREECLAEQAEIINFWQEAMDEAEAQNQKLGENLAKFEQELADAKKARTKRIIKYVESDPDSNTVIFDSDGLSILNSAQQGIPSSGK